MPSERSMSSSRVIGLDFARAIALMFMIFINFGDIMAKDGDWFLKLVSCIEGRAAATFVMLAGMGVVFLYRSCAKYNNVSATRNARRTLSNRASFLLLTGFLNLQLWDVDILHFYCIFLLVGGICITFSNRVLCLLILIVFMLTIVMRILTDWDSEWSYKLMSPEGYWVFIDMIRYFMLKGNYPVFPWIVFLLIGILLGRRDLSQPAMRWIVILTGICMLIAAGTLSENLTMAVLIRYQELDVEIFFPLTRIIAWPPSPLWTISAVGSAVVTIMLSIMIAEKFSNTGWVKSIATCGRMSLTLYILHTAIIIGVPEKMGFSFSNRSTAAIVSLSFCCLFCFLVFSVWWEKRWGNGPFEQLMRRFNVFGVMMKKYRCRPN